MFFMNQIAFLHENLKMKKLCSYKFLAAPCKSKRKNPPPSSPHLIHTEDADPLAAQPLVELCRPVVHQAAWCDHQDALSDGSPSIRSLFEQRPGECHALEGLPQTHLVRQDGPIATRSSEVRTHTIRSIDLFVLLGIPTLAVMASNSTGTSTVTSSP